MIESEEPFMPKVMQDEGWVWKVCSDCRSSVLVWEHHEGAVAISVHRGSDGKSAELVVRTRLKKWTECMMVFPDAEDAVEEARRVRRNVVRSAN